MWYDTKVEREVGQLLFALVIFSLITSWIWCRVQSQASSLQQSNEDVIDCLPELIDYVGGHHERLQALVGPTLTNTQIEQVTMHNYTVSQKNAPTLASCSFDKRGLILIIFDKQHQHTVKNDLLVQLFLSLHFYLLYLILNIGDKNDAFLHHSMLVKQFSSFIRKHYLSRSVSAKQSGWLQNLWTDAGTCVHRTNNCPWYQPLWPATWNSASLTHGQAYHKTSSTKHMVNGESGYVQTWGKRTSLWTAAKLKPALSELTHYITGSFQNHQQSTKEKTLLCVISVAAIWKQIE